MPDPCFCALELVSSQPSRIPPSYTYLGYECDGAVVTLIDSTRTFNTPMPVAPEGTPMPAENDPCSCDGVDYCRTVTFAAAAEPQAEGVQRMRAAAGAAATAHARDAMR